MRASAKTIDVAGLPVSYLEDGAANPRALVLLAGGIGDAAANWETVLPALALDYHVYAPDLPGFGGSAPLAEMTAAGLIEWLRGLLDALDLSDAVLVGSFWGALLARLFAAAAPQYVPALVLINGGTIPQLPRGVAALTRLPLVGGPLFQMVGRLVSAQGTPHDMVYHREVIKDEFLAAWQANQAGFIGLIHAFLLKPLPTDPVPPVPTLILWGAEDKLVTLTSVWHLQAELGGAQLEMIADCGNLPQVEADDVVAFQITAFLDRLSRPLYAALPGVGLLHLNST